MSDARRPVPESESMRILREGSREARHLAAQERMAEAMERQAESLDEIARVLNNIDHGLEKMQTLWAARQDEMDAQKCGARPQCRAVIAREIEIAFERARP